MGKALSVRVAVAAVALVGCGQSPSRAPVGDWSAPSTYEFTVDSACGERSFLGRYHIVVEDGQISSVEGLDERSVRLMEQAEFRALAPTLSDLEDEVRQAREQRADVADITYDDELGHPASINIDWQAEATDDEACYEITDFDTPDRS